MVYYTRFSLEIFNCACSSNPLEVEDVVNLLGGFDPFDGEGHKWSDHDKDMRMISSIHPDAIFMLDGRGVKEEQDTIVKNQIDAKKLGSAVANAARPWFIKRINS